MFACAPECGCTLACSAPNSAFARAMASALDDVDELAAAVVALARIAFGVLVGQHRAGRFEHRAADEVLGRDQLEAAVLPVQLVARSRRRSRDRSRRACATSTGVGGVGRHTCLVADCATCSAALVRCLRLI